MAVFLDLFSIDSSQKYDIRTIIDPVWSRLGRGATRVKDAILFAVYFRKSALF
jgi:hypothetical protein